MTRIASSIKVPEKFLQKISSKASNSEEKAKFSVVSSFMSLYVLHEKKLQVCETCSNAVRGNPPEKLKDLPWIVFATCPLIEDSCSCAKRPIYLARSSRKCPIGKWDKIP